MTCPHASTCKWTPTTPGFQVCETPGCGIERPTPGQHPAMVLAAWRKGEREVEK